MQTHAESKQVLPAPIGTARYFKAVDVSEEDLASLAYSMNHFRILQA